MKQINWGFIGCGEVTEKKSGPAFNEVEGSQVVAVMSRSENKARSYAERHHIRKWYTDAQELIDDPDVNAIYIATPPSSHATFAIMAMRAGKPVYIEKPLAASYNDCIRINRISEQTGVPCFVAYYRRYLPYFQKVKEIIQNGTIGKVINVQIRFSVPPRDLDYKNERNCHGDCSRILRVEAISMIWLHTRLICCRIFSVLSLVHMVILLIVLISTKQKILFRLVSSSKMELRVVVAGALWDMRVQRKTVSRLSVIRVPCLFRYLHTNLSFSLPVKENRVLPYLILPMCNCR